MSEDNNIPKHWKLKKLLDIGEIISGGTPSTTIKDYWDGNIPWISPADLSGYKQKTIIKGRKSITESGLKNSSARLMPKGSVLFSSRAPIGYVVICANQVSTNQGFKSIIPNETIFNEYLFYYLKASKQKAENAANGTTFKEISLKAFSQLEIPVPPHQEQQTIVSKIEELLSDLDNGKQQLLLAHQQLKVYRQSLLKWAFEGKLTNNDVKDGELPLGWKWRELKEITSVLGDGLHGTPKYDENGEYFFINGNNLTNGKIEIKHNTKRVGLDEFKKYKKPLNDRTVFISINGSLGYTAFYNNEKIILGKSACYFNLIDSIDKHYIRYYLTSNKFINYANNNATGSTIKNVGLKAMRDFKIPIPSNLEEQQLIVEELESKLTVCDKIEETISKSLKQAETLRQSILKKAFEGKLV